MAELTKKWAALRIAWASPTFSSQVWKAADSSFCAQRCTAISNFPASSFCSYTLETQVRNDLETHEFVHAARAFFRRRTTPIHSVKVRNSAFCVQNRRDFWIRIFSSLEMTT